MHHFRAVSSPPSLSEVFSVLDEAHRSKSNAAVLRMLQSVMMNPEVLSVVFLSKPDTCTKSNRAGIHLLAASERFLVARYTDGHLRHEVLASSKSLTQLHWRVSVCLKVFSLKRFSFLPVEEVMVT